MFGVRREKMMVMRGFEMKVRNATYLVAGCRIVEHC